MGKSILITGCSSGIGHHVALGLRQRGYRVFATARKPEDVEHLLEQGFESCQLDVDDTESINSAVRWVLEQTGGGLDALFNNAGFGQPGAVEDLSRQALREQFETNLFGAHELACRVLPAMRRQGHGRIIQHSSVLGLITLKYRGAYNASKFALEGLSDTLRQELHGSGIQVSLIETGPVISHFRENAYAKFKQNIDRVNSPHSATYAAVEQRLAAQGNSGKKDPFTLRPEAVLLKVLHALEARQARPRYYVTTPTHIFGTLRRLLSTRALDWVLRAVADRENR
ncbi:SDR family NAD(P)-dependent oxidoreductase [Marinobacterium sedimentorum]|uniref:SDR family NAD(P)-dependent oxidoreductase n=1 Tax=Marinobacterium sedimentorum TaxID=2927804 RepID=UPI0020C729B6|nr:SDR family NAD(P)-dependent oxidoreductase [Marinobacterium sedimentorum]MCP8690059.1 SDR family NAD(P)-dependent oxidoreductase [Marinobacterium sedimentorum]